MKRRLFNHLSRGVSAALLVVTSAVAGFAIAEPAHAAATTRYVATTGDDTENDCSSAASPCFTIVHAAEDEAIPGDTVSVAAGSYHESVTVFESLTIVGAGAGQTIVDGDSESGAASFLVSNLGDAPPPTVTLSNLSVSGNADNDGIDVHDATLALTDAEVSSNDASGMRVTQGPATVTVTDSALDNNSEDGVLVASGQAADVTVVGSELSANARAGAEHQGTGTLGITDSRLARNALGGVYFYGAGLVGTLSASTADSNGLAGVYVGPGAAATVSESTLFHNAQSGVDVANGAQASIKNSTITATTPPLTSGPGPAGIVVESGGQLSMSGTLDASNQTADCVGTVTDAGYNLDSDGTCSLQAAAGSRSDAVADLGSLGAHGGPTPTVVPGVASAARNAIPAGQARCSATLTDQRGFPRRSPAAGNCDIGSVEATVINPRITATISSTHPKRHGWYRGVVTVRYHCATGSAAIVGGCPLATSFRSSSRDHHVTKTITAADGGSATVHVSGIKLDNRKPRVRIKGALNNHSYHSVRALHARCRDGLSGIARCRVHSHRSGNTVHYRAVARDRAGNVRYRKGHYFLV